MFAMSEGVRRSDGSAWSRNGVLPAAGDEGRYLAGCEHRLQGRLDRLDRDAEVVRPLPVDADAELRQVLLEIQLGIDQARVFLGRFQHRGSPLPHRLEIRTADHDPDRRRAATQAQTGRRGRIAAGDGHLIHPGRDFADDLGNAPLALVPGREAQHDEGTVGTTPAAGEDEDRAHLARGVQRLHVCST